MVTKLDFSKVCSVVAELKAINIIHCINRLKDKTPHPYDFPYAYEIRSHLNRF